MLDFKKWFNFKKDKIAQDSVPNNPNNRIYQIRQATNAAYKVLDELKGYNQQNLIKEYPFQAPEILKCVLPEGVKAPVQLACDSSIGYSMFGQNCYGYGTHQGFPGFAYLSELTTIAEYRSFAYVNAMEITREWITLTTSSKQDKNSKEKIAILDKKLKEIDLRSVIRTAAEHVDCFGRAQIMLDIDGSASSKPLILSPKTIKKGSFRIAKCVEPIWSTPSFYNSNNPVAPDFYRPSVWYVLGKEVHASRLLTIITRPLPDLLKPMFNFAGISLNQLAEPYVNNWLRTKQAISNLLNNFSTLTLSTDMVQRLQDNNESGNSLSARIQYFMAARNNQGLMLLDRETEELTQLAVPLSGLHELQSQSQEHMCAVSGIPAVKLLGVSPQGFNATADGEIRAFYDRKSAEQEAHYRYPIETILKILMLSEFGEIDPSISFRFNPLWQMDAKDEATIKLTNAQKDSIYIDHGVLSNMEVREKLASDEESGYNAIEVSDIDEESLNTEENEKPYEEGVEENEERKDEDD